MKSDGKTQSPHPTGAPNNLESQAKILGSPATTGTSQPVNELPPPTVPAAPPAPPVPSAGNGNPLTGLMGGGNKPNPLGVLLNSSLLDTLPEGKQIAAIKDWGIAVDAFGELRSVMPFQFEQGELEGKQYEYKQKVTERSFRFVRGALEVASGQSLSADNPDDVFDAANNCAGPIRSRIVGALVELEVKHREWNDRTYVNIDILKLLQPAPLGTGHSNNS